MNNTFSRLFIGTFFVCCLASFIPTHGVSKSQLTSQKDTVTVKGVIEAYIKALGGKKKIRNINTMLYVAEAKADSAVLKIKAIRSNSNKLVQEVTLNGNILQKKVLNGNQGYTIEDGKRIPLTGEKLQETIKESIPVEELEMINDDSASYKGKKTIDGHEYYVVAYDETIDGYFDTTTHLLMMNTFTSEQDGQTSISKNVYGDYKQVKNGILIPYLLTINADSPRPIHFKVTEIKFDEGVTDADFE